MKITLIVNTLMPNSSIARVTINLLELFKKKNHKIRIITSEYDKSFIKKYGIDESDIKYIKFLKVFNILSELPWFGYFFSLIKFNLLGFLSISEILRDRPDVINSHYYLSGLSGYIITKFTRIPHVLTIHGINLSKENINKILFWVVNLTINFLKKRIKHIISVESTLKTSEQFSDVKDRIEVIYPCIDGQYIQLLGKISPIEAEPSTNRLIYVGRLEKVKGLDKLFQGLARITQSWEELKIIGSGNYEKTLKRLAVKLKISRKLKFSGFKEGLEKINLMNDSDIFISYSRSEGFPLVLLEFFALGKPCIIYPISPFADEKGRLNHLGVKFKDEKLGLFLNPKQNNLNRILKLDKIREYFSNDIIQYRKKMIKEFYPEIIANQYLKYYKSILGLE